MKNKYNKKARLEMRRIFTKDQLLVYKKYSRLLSYNIPYDIINRAYKRYLKNIDEYIEKNGYPEYWFSKNKVTFCNAVKIYIVTKEDNHIFKFGSRGYTQIEIVKVSGIDKYLEDKYLDKR
ncbi:MAG: hypothetical protein PHT02_00850 [Tissierellia bacterium]|nr:hypothetical protein [Tissierellia bacterium]